MADEFTLTGQCVRIVSNKTQPFEQALDVSDYDELDLLLGVVGFEGVNPSVTVSILTGMCNRTDDGWVVLATFDPITQPNVWVPKNIKGLLKYLRWQVTNFAGNSATFTLRGMARQWS